MTTKDDPHRVLPEPSASASIVRARRHGRGNLEIRMQIPNTSLVNRKDSKVLGLDGVGIGIVGDGERTTSKIGLAGGVELREGLTGARVVRLVGGANITAIGTRNISDGDRGG